MDRCIAKIILRKCGALPEAFQDYVPEARIIDNGNGSFQCFANMFSEYMINPQVMQSQCNCQQPCIQLFYMVTQNFLSSNTKKKWWLKIRFKSKMVNIIKEYPLYKIEELISQVGGSCGLFLGMSILSVVEIIFHAVISFIRYFV